MLTVSLLALSGWGYLTVQAELNPILEELKEKDQRDYEKMLSKFKGFSFKEGMKLYHHIKNTSKAQYIEMHFLEMRAKWYEDKDFRKEEQGKEIENRKLRKKGMGLENESRIAELKALGEKEKNKALRIHWEGSPTWQKALVLREKCNKFLNLEKSSSDKRLNVHNIPRTVTRLGSSGHSQDSVAELCERMIPMDYDEQGLEKSLQALREEMNYYYFVELIREIGIARDRVYPEANRLKRMATDFIDYN